MPRRDGRQHWRSRELVVSVHFVCFCGQAAAALLAAILAVEGAILEEFLLEDVSLFRLTSRAFIWEILRPDMRTGSCHARRGAC